VQAHLVNVQGSVIVRQALVVVTQAVAIVAQARIGLLQEVESETQAYSFSVVGQFEILI
jgi:hypothetical protein